MPTAPTPSPASQPASLPASQAPSQPASQPRAASLRSALRTTSVLVFTTDTDLRYTSFHVPRQGPLPDHLLGRQDEQVFTPETAAVLWDLKARALSLAAPVRDEIALRIEGEPFVYDVIADPVVGADGSVSGLTVAMTDVTARWLAEEALRRQHEATAREHRRMQAVLDVLPVGVYIAEADGRIREGNRAGRTIWQGDLPQVSPDEYHVYKAWWAASGRRIEAEDWAMARAIRDGSTSDAEEIIIECFDGSRKFILNYALPIRNASGQIEGGVAVNVDITRLKDYERRLQELTETLEERVARRTAELASLNDQLRLEIEERRLVEEALRRSEERFSTIFRRSPVAVCLTEIERGEVLDVNPAFCRLSGYDPEALIGRTPDEVGLLGAPFSRGEDERLLHGQDASALESRLTRRDGEIREVLVSEQIIDLGGVRCVLGMLQDITARKRLEQEILEVAEAERQRLGRDIHDSLGQQLTGIGFFSKALAEQLVAEGSPHVPHAQHITRMLTEAIHATRSLARRLAPVDDPGEGLMDALRQLAEHIEQVFDLPCRFQAETPVLIEDAETATHLYRIAQEASNNAVKHARPTRISLSLTRTDFGAMLRIDDDGAGIASEALRSADGMGLRTMAYRANLIGGRLEVQRLPSGGTTVTCAFPLPQASSQGPDVP